MSDDGFFGSVFNNPEDDPLLHSDEDPSLPEEDDLVPSWMGEESDSAATEVEPPKSEDPAPAPSWAPAEDSEAPEEETSEQKEIVIDSDKANSENLDAVNEAVQQGWRLKKIDLDLSPPLSSSSDARVVVFLERESPQSLFEFGSS